MSEISKEELAIMIDVQSKTVVNLEKIAHALKNIVEEQKELKTQHADLKEVHHIQHNELKDSCSCIATEIKSGTIIKKLSSMHLDILFTKYLFSSAGILIVIAYVVLHFINP